MEVLKVASNSKPGSVAGAIAGYVREQGEVEMKAVGAGAINQAVKAVAIAGGFLAPIEIASKIEFTTININDEARTAIKIKVEKR